MASMNTKLKGKRLDAQQLAKAVVDQVAKIGKPKSKKAKAKR